MSEMDEFYFPEDTGTEIDYTITVFGIEFAPIMISFERRMQTFAIGIWCLYMWIAIIANFVKLIFLFTSLSLIPFGISYLIWIYWDRNTPYSGGRRFSLLRRLQFWKYFRDYFPIRLVKTTNLPASENYLFCVYPHGRLCCGAILNFATDSTNFHKLYPGLEAYILTCSYFFYIPFMRDNLLSLGACSVKPGSIRNLLGGAECGRVAVVAPGGISEILVSAPGKYQFSTKYQKEIVRSALTVGASLVPVISFGENELYNVIGGQFMKKFQDIMLKYTGCIPIIPNGRGFFQYNFGILPHRKPINTVVGGSIKLPKIDVPSEEQVDFYHKTFIQALEKLFHNYKSDYDEHLGEKAELTIIN